MIAASSVKYRTALQSVLQSRPRFWFWMGLLTIVLFGLVLAVASAGHALRIDEPLTANLVHPPLLDALFVNWHNSIRPVYFVLVHLWTAVFGDSEIALRSLSILCFGLTVVTVGMVARRLAGWSAGLVAALLLASSTDMALAHATNARPYALLGLEAALTLLLWSQLMRVNADAGDTQPRRLTLTREIGLLAALTILSVIGLLTHTMFVFCMSAYTGAAIFVSRRLFAGLFISSALAVALFLLLRGALLFQRVAEPSLDWMPAPTLADLKMAFMSLWGTKKTLLLLLYITGLLLLRFRQSIGLLRSRVFLVSVSLLIIGSIFPFVASYIKVVFNPERTPMLFLPAVCITLAIFISRVGYRPLTLLVLGLLALGSVNTTVREVRTANASGSVRTSVQYAVAHAACGDTFLLGGLSFAEVSYYMRQFNAPACLQVETFPQDTQSHPGWMDVAGLLQQREQLAEEAAATVVRLAAQPEGRIWLFYNGADGPVTTTYGSAVTAILTEELDQQFVMTQELDLNGSFFNHILIYTSPKN